MGLHLALHLNVEDLQVLPGCKQKHTVTLVGMSAPHKLRSCVKHMHNQMNLSIDRNALDSVKHLRLPEEAGSWYISDVCGVQLVLRERCNHTG